MGRGRDRGNGRGRDGREKEGRARLGYLSRVSEFLVMSLVKIPILLRIN